MNQALVSQIMQFAFATLLPVLVSIIITMAEKRTAWGKVGYWPKQITYGIVFGAVAIYGTEFGIVTNDATMNVRDAAPLVAGLYFGGPAGIIAGVIGGVERWFAALWGRGMFTRIACSVATLAIGLYAYSLRKFVFDNRRPSWLMGFSVGVVAEVLHMFLVFVTNLDNSARAFLVAQACTLPMVSCVALSVGISGAVRAIMDGKKLSLRSEKAPDISQKVQFGMLGVVFVGFFATVGFVYALQTNLANTDTYEVLSTELTDVEEDIKDASDANLLSLARRVATDITSVKEASQETIDRLKNSLDLAEVNIVDNKGIVVASSDKSIVGFDMASGEQSAEFLPLLPGGSATQIVQSYQPMAMNSNVYRKYAGVRIKDGFLQVGHDAERFISALTDDVRTAVANRHVGHDGQLVVLSGRGELVGNRSDVDLGYDAVQKLASATFSSPEGSVFDVTVSGVPYLAMHNDTEGLTIISMLPRSEAITSRNLSVLITSFIEVMVFAAIFVAIYILIKNVVVRSIWQVNGRLGQITDGDLTVEVDVRDSAEFASLSDDINGTVTALRNAIAAESARIETDLATAKAIQESALPRTFPPFPDIDAFDIFASMNAAREVGGDFYDFFLVDAHTLAFLIADVSGKGIPAALFMMAAKSELSNYIKSGMELSEAVQSANWNLCQRNEAEMFVTVWAATLDFDTGVLTYVNAGHNPPLLRHDGQWTWLKDRTGLFIGGFDMAKYKSTTVNLVPGDEILLYTDGVNEALSTNEEEYGNERLEKFLSSHTDLHPRMLVDVLRSDVRAWANGAEQSDDITIVCLEYGTPPEVTSTITVPATNKGLAELMRRFHFELSQLQCPSNVQMELDHTVEELFTNTCTHGYTDSDEPGEVQLSYVYDTSPAALTVSMTDWGKEFDPLAYDGPQDGAASDEVTGMGITMAIQHVDDFAYVRDGNSNVIAFRKTW